MGHSQTGVLFQGGCKPSRQYLFHVRTLPSNYNPNQEQECQAFHGFFQTDWRLGCAVVLWLEQAALWSHKMSESATAGVDGPVRGTLDSGFTEEPLGLWENASVDLFLDEICTDMGLKSVPLTFPPSICPGNASDFDEGDVAEQQKVPSNVSGLEEAWGQERPLSKDEEVPTLVSIPQPDSPPVLSIPEPSWVGEVVPLGTETSPASFTSLLPTAPLKVPKSAVLHGVAVPAVTPLQVTSHPEGLTSADYEEAASQGVGVSQVEHFSDKTKRKKRTARALGLQERMSRPLGIVGWSALGRFRQVKASPLQLWIRSDRYPDLNMGSPPSVFTRAVPTLKALLPVRIPEALPHALTYIECGYLDPSFPLDRCRVLCPTISSWESHQFLTHALGFLCPACHIWLSSEQAVTAHAVECQEPGV